MGFPGHVFIGNVAVDGGDNSACPPTDQRGEVRLFDADGDGKAECDIGAFELREGPLTCSSSPCGVAPSTATPTAAPITLPTGGGSPAAGFPVPALALTTAAILSARRRA